MSEIYEIADDVYRITTSVSNYPVDFCQFLIKDERPLLFETGHRGIFPETLEAVKKIVDPATLRYISWSHLEGDECGAVNDFLQVAPGAEPVAGAVGAFLSVGDFISRAVKVMNDGEVLDLGRHKVRILLTPHVPHAWDAILLYEEATGTLLASDLFAQLGQTKPTTDSDIVEPALSAYRQFPDYLPLGPHIAKSFERLEALKPKVLAGHHAPAYIGDVARALRDFRTGLFEAVKS